MELLSGIKITELLNYGLGSAMTVLLVLAMIYFMNKLVNGLGQMIKEQGITLKDIANTLSNVQVEIKELREGQESLWGEVKTLKSNVFKKKEKQREE